MELHRLRASQVSVAQPLRVIYHWYPVMSNSIFGSSINSLCVSVCNILILFGFGVQTFFFIFQCFFRLVPSGIQRNICKNTALSQQNIA